MSANKNHGKDGRDPIEAFCEFISPYRFGLTIDPARVTEDQLAEAMPRIVERLMQEFRIARQEAGL